MRSRHPMEIPSDVFYTLPYALSSGRMVKRNFNCCIFLLSHLDNPLQQHCIFQVLPSFHHIHAFAGLQAVVLAYRDFAVYQYLKVLDAILWAVTRHFICTRRNRYSRPTKVQAQRIRNAAHVHVRLHEPCDCWVAAVLHGYRALEFSRAVTLLLFQTAVVKQTVFHLEKNSFNKWHVMQN